ncbi:phospholipid phosphatase 3-like [Mya arenaria]|uniref:phospholipid phosphatase 3-like n=1 Tax=Mya arenaria TaxID=6604 RepID=UPI0022DEC75D|nr:phospholipid phosphatase 3-like [Mya arenaria]
MVTGSVASIAVVIVEIALLLCISAVTLLLSFNMTGLGPTRRGFFCDDESISYPYRTDTVSDSVLIACFIGVPVIIMVFVETLHACIFRSREGKQISCQIFLSHLYRAVGSFLFGQMSSSLVMETTKLFAGRLRPNFLSVCDIDLDLVNCSQGHVEIDDSTCRNDDKSMVMDARKSFPSGHASLAVFTIVFLSIYLHERFIWARKVRIFIPTIQTGLLIAGVYICISRMSDNRHHAGDIIAGAVLGLVFALLVKLLLPCARVRRAHRRPLDTSGSLTTVNSDIIDMKF